MSKIIGKGKKPTAKNNRQEKSKKLSKNPDSKRASKILQDLKFLDSQGLLGKLMRDRLRTRTAPNQQKKPLYGRLGSTESKYRPSSSSGIAPSLAQSLPRNVSRVTPELQKAFVQGRVMQHLGSQLAMGVPVSMASGHSNGSHGDVLNRTEFVGDIVVSGTEFSAFQAGLNPGNQLLFRWLSQVATAWKLWRFVASGNHPGFVIELRPINGTQRDGGVAAVFRPNTYDVVVASKSEMLNTDGAFSGPLWQGFILALDAEQMNRVVPWRYVVPEGETPDGDANLSDAGTVTWATYGAVESVPMELWVHYNVQFASAAVNPLGASRIVSVQDTEGSAGIDETAFLGTAPFTSTQGGYFTQVEGKDPAWFNYSTLSCPDKLSNDCKNGYYMISFMQEGPGDIKTTTDSAPGHMHIINPDGTTSSAINGIDIPSRGLKWVNKISTVGISTSTQDTKGGFEKFVISTVPYWRTIGGWLIDGAKFFVTPEDGKSFSPKLIFDGAHGGTAAGFTWEDALVLITRITSGLFTALTNAKTDEDWLKIENRSHEFNRHRMKLQDVAARRERRFRIKQCANERKQGKRSDALIVGNSAIPSRNSVGLASLLGQTFVRRPPPLNSPVEDDDVEMSDAKELKTPKDERDNGEMLRVVQDGSKIRVVPVNDLEPNVRFVNVRASPAQTPIVVDKANTKAGWFQ